MANEQNPNEQQWGLKVEQTALCLYTTRQPFNFKKLISFKNAHNI